MELIPGLANDMARECLVRVPYDLFSMVASTCRNWKALIQLPEFFQHRKVAGFSQPVFIMTQTRADPNGSYGAVTCPAMPVYRLMLCQPDMGTWRELPPVSDFSDGLPMFCQVVGVGSDLVVVGGWHPKTLGVSNAVYIYSFVSAKWRRGADMPGVRRSFFGCASDSDRTVYVAGGHDGDKNALGSAMAYDVASNEWVPLPDMAKERDECKGVFHGGKFHVIGGYCTDRQGQFESTAEAFDVAKWQWDMVHEDFLGTGMCPRTCVGGDDGKLYMCRAGEVAAWEEDTWKAVAGLPADVCNTALVMTWQGKLLVIGSASFGGPRMTYVLDLKNYAWTKMEVPVEHSGHVQSGCYLEL